jgi:ribulose-5-phosphate 4-epimerase/fuculose-1-phosphate aldolase
MNTTIRKLKTPSVRDRVSEEEWNARVELAAAYRLTHLHGWAVTLIYNHISARVPGEEHHILLNPFGLRYDEVTASNLVKIDLDGNIVDDSPHQINQAGYVIHSAVHAAREDVACAFHTHTESGIAVASLAEGLVFSNQDVMMLYGHVGYHDFEGIALDLDERARLVADLGNNMALILRNHGLLTVGRSIGEAFVLMFFLEKACRIQLHQMATGGKVIPLTDAVCQHTADQYGLAAKPMGELEWPGLLRLMDETDPSYKE